MVPDKVRQENLAASTPQTRQFAHFVNWHTTNTPHARTGGWNPQADNIDFENLVPEDIAAQVDQAFANCDVNLRHAGGGRELGQAYKVVTYATDVAAAHEHIVRNLRRWMPENPPMWTELGVAALGAPGMKFEIDVEAYDPEGAPRRSLRRGEGSFWRLAGIERERVTVRMTPFEGNHEEVGKRRRI